MIKFSIDRIANVFSIDMPNNADDVLAYKKMHFDTLANIILDSLNNSKPDDVEIDCANYGVSVQYYLIALDEKEPLFNLQVLEYSNGLRFDFNPKRVRSDVWLLDVVKDVKQYALDNGFKSHNTQIDLALDFINHGPLVDSMSFVKFGVKRTALFEDVSGNVETEYYGKRGSSGYLRIYNKRAERLHQITLKYSKIKRVAKAKYYDMMMTLDNVSHDDVLNNFSDLDLDLVVPLMSDNVDLSKSEHFDMALDLSLGMRKDKDVDAVPASWKRFEIVSRTKRISSDKVTFEDDEILKYLEGIHNFDLNTISDYRMRALVLGVENGYVQLSELTNFEKITRKAILKSDVVFQYRDSGRRYFVKTEEDFLATVDPSKVTITKTIKKYNDHTLRDEVISEFEKVKDDLKAELYSYSIN